MDSQLNELSKASGNPNRYNHRSNKKVETSNIPEQPTRAEKPDKDVAGSNKGKKIQVPTPVAQIHFPKVK
jgi:hypothetical protein